MVPGEDLHCLKEPTDWAECHSRVGNWESIERWTNTLGLFIESVDNKKNREYDSCNMLCCTTNEVYTKPA